MTIDPRLHRIVAAQPHPLLFATISGAHLYGFPSPNSDFDLRGAHLLPLEAVVGLETPEETIEDARIIDGLEMDIVSHDVKKFFNLVLRPNGYVLEQLWSPLIVQTSPGHEELKAIARRCVTRHHAHHYLGFASTQWKLFEKEQPRRIKPLLYMYRVLLTGLHLLRTGVVEANLVTLNEAAELPFLADLVRQKQSGENATFVDPDVTFHAREFERLERELQSAHETSQLPELPPPEARQQLHELLIRLRTGRS